jgi:hypothetical protein
LRFLLSWQTSFPGFHLGQTGLIKIAMLRISFFAGRAGFFASGVVCPLKETALIRAYQGHV